LGRRHNRRQPPRHHGMLEAISNRMEKRFGFENCVYVDLSYAVMNAYWNRSHKPGGDMTLGEFSGREVISVLDGIRENAPAGMEVSIV